MREQFTVVALPHSGDPDADFHVSLFVAPDIEVDDPRDTLAVTELFLHWTKALANATFVLEDDNGEIECTPLLEAIEEGLWEEVFPEQTPVTSYVPPDWSQHPWRTFRPGLTTGVAKAVNLLSTMANGVEPPTVQQVPWFGTEVFGPLAGGGEGRQRINPLDLVGRFETQQTERLDAACPSASRWPSSATRGSTSTSSRISTTRRAGRAWRSPSWRCTRPAGSTPIPRRRPTTSGVPTPTIPGRRSPRSRFPTSTPGCR